MTLHAILFWVLALLTGGSALALVVTQNVVRSATWLLFSLAGAAGIFFLLGADFVGATQLLVYVGGTLVLVVFGVMLTAQGPFITMRTGAAEWAFSLLVGIVFFGVLAMTIIQGNWPDAIPNPRMDDPNRSVSSVAIGESLLGIESASPAGLVTLWSREPSDPDLKKITRRRQQMSYLLPFEIVSVHLLVVLLGAAYLARAKRRRGLAVSATTEPARSVS